MRVQKERGCSWCCYEGFAAQWHLLCKEADAVVQVHLEGFAQQRVERLPRALHAAVRAHREAQDPSQPAEERRRASRSGKRCDTHKPYRAVAALKEGHNLVLPALTVPCLRHRCLSLGNALLAIDPPIHLGDYSR